MEAALAQIKQVAGTVTEETRQHLIKSLHEIADSLETPEDTVHRYGHHHLETAAVIVGFDLGLFKFLTEREGPVTTEEISQEVNAETMLMTRLLRYLAAIGAISEVAKSQYSANHITSNLAQRVTEAGVKHYFYTVGPQYQALPPFLKKTEHRNPTDNTKTVFQDAFKTSLTGFAWFTENPEHLTYFNDYMALRRQPEATWLTAYPIEEKTKGWDAARPVYVNIGGGVGHQCAQFKEKYPNVEGRVVLQDLPHTIEKAIQTPGVENLAHDFFEPQPIKGARFYYLRAVLHDHPPHRQRKILQNIKDAMIQDSILLIDEMVLPDMGVHVNAASIDMTMLGAFGSMERSETQWREVIEGAGLELIHTHPYNPLVYESVLEARLPQQDV